MMHWNKRSLYHKLQSTIDDFSIKKKFYTLYILCVLIPLVLTDSVIIYSVIHSEQITKRHEMENTANAVQYSFYSSIQSAAELSKSIYMDKYIYEFLDREYVDSLDYVTAYQNFFTDTLLKNSPGMDKILITMYSDNDTLVNGGEFEQMDKVRDSEWYQYLKRSGLDKALYFEYDDSKSPAVEPKRKIFFVQKLDFYSDVDREKILRIELDYGNMTRNLVKMSFDAPVYICCNDEIVLSNGKYSSVGKDFEPLKDEEEIAYEQELNLYGADLQIVVLKTETRAWREIMKNMPLILCLILLNIILPVLMFKGFNRSFITRVGELARVFNSIEDDHLIEIGNVRGKDEIGALMYNYNKMAARINDLIEIVYKNKIKEQEMMVARQNAELLALHSQINPHFLFNALESIRMHSILKREFETADMVEKLAIMQRQYVEWGNDTVSVSKEMEFVEAYLLLQKYRFGDRLSFELDVEEECKEINIPKLSVVTFVENACVHGIESKTAPGWIFVRIYKKEQWIYLEIEDTGIGMSPDVMKELLTKMQKASLDLLKGNDRVGIINACLRLKMETKDKVQFELDGEEGIGTMVQIRIPV